jgi:hypothetical protein
LPKGHRRRRPGTSAGVRPTNAGLVDQLQLLAFWVAAFGGLALLLSLFRSALIDGSRQIHR